MSEISPYGLTAARKHERPGRETRPRSTTVDIHSHVSVPAAAAIVQPHLDISTIPLAFFSTADTKRVNAQQEIDRYTRISGQENGLAERLNDLDAMGIDVQLVKCHHRFNVITLCRLGSASERRVFSTTASPSMSREGRTALLVAAFR